MTENKVKNDEYLSLSSNRLNLDHESIEMKMNLLSFEFEYKNHSETDRINWVFSGVSLYSCMLLAGLGMQSIDNDGYNQIFHNLDSPGSTRRTSNVFNNVTQISSVQDDIITKFQNMENRLKIPSLSSPEPSSSLSSLTRKRYEADHEEVQLVFSHSAWRRRGSTSFKDSYIELIKNTFNNFHASEFTKIEEINNYIKEKTRGKISNLLNPSDPSSFCLISAIYFKGKWANPFKPHMTMNIMFDRTTPCDMMEQTNHFNYYKPYNDMYQAIALPYKCHGTSLDLRAVIILRNNEFNEKETNGSKKDGDMSIVWQELFSNLKDNKATYKRGMIKFPRFKATRETELNEFLKNQLKITEIFENPHCFKGMFDPYPCDGVLLDQVKQVAVIECDEYGTEAAAATVMAMRKACFKNERKIEFEMICDRPFEFFIVDFGSDSGLQLFGGHITKTSITPPKTDETGSSTTPDDLKLDSLLIK